MKNVSFLKIASAIFIFVSAQNWVSGVLIAQTTSYITAQRSELIKNVSFGYEGVISNSTSIAMHEIDTIWKTNQ